MNWISNVDTWTTTASSSSSIENENNNDNYDVVVSSSMWLERYIAAIVYFSTDGKSWEEDNANLWLSSVYNICDWKGIQCNGNVQVEEIDLCKYDLFPFESCFRGVFRIVDFVRDFPIVILL